MQLLLTQVLVSSPTKFLRAFIMSKDFNQPPVACWSSYCFFPHVLKIQCFLCYFCCTIRLSLSFLSAIKSQKDSPKHKQPKERSQLTHNSEVESSAAKERRLLKLANQEGTVWSALALTCWEKVITFRTQKSILGYCDIYTYIYVFLRENFQIQIT